MSIDALTVTRLPDAVYDALRESIVDGRDAPGSPVTEQAIADRFGVARPTAKAALERLVAEGLLRRAAHKTARVPELERADIIDLYANRATLEVAALAGLAAAVAAGTTPVPDAALTAQRTLTDALDSRTAPTAPLARADIAFHRALVEAQPSPRLARLHALLMGEIELCTGQVQSHRLLALADVVDQHQGILDAVAAGDAERAASLTRAHIEGARDRLLAHYDATHPATTHSTEGPTDG
ncbi:GntR family transcriptional regulator [Microcella alkaliphila]|uniref:Transcriptional regulator, GntR family protein n=1 Tax=Microcella alkaliphila TaxID=279828 RepID=A0A0U5CDQ0_9MICO|nr:GntR family transcriptional regulator [Microcella alkaliphila]BAU31218.1 transcriptional regulator, GntR family protein [Microcella alkaliphila]